MRYRMLGWLSASILALFVAGCAVPSPGQRIDSADELARLGRFVRLAPEGSLPTTGFVRAGSESELVVYLEGDGFAFANPYLPSDNPTPINPLALKLAVADSRPRILYIARPCQFSRQTPPPSPCAVRYWTTHRYAEEIVRSVDTVLEAELRRRPARGVHLVGYSGGGAVAVLVAARRGDVLSLTTIAGNLDHRLHTSTFNLQPLAGSLEPREAAPAVARIPQIHYAGSRDPVVPPSIARSFMSALRASPCATLEIVDGATHIEPWVAIWPRLLARRPQCRS